MNLDAWTDRGRQTDRLTDTQTGIATLRHDRPRERLSKNVWILQNVFWWPINEPIELLTNQTSQPNVSLMYTRFGMACIGNYSVDLVVMLPSLLGHICTDVQQTSLGHHQSVIIGSPVTTNLSPTDGLWMVAVADTAYYSTTILFFTSLYCNTLYCISLYFTLCSALHCTAIHYSACTELHY